MTSSLLPIISYILISSFTLGPSNISSASMAALHGYKNTLTYQAGLAAGVFLLMLLSGWFSSTLLDVFPAFEPIMRYVGAAYILYLASGILKASYTFNEQDSKPFRVPARIYAADIKPQTHRLCVYLVLCIPRHYEQRLNRPTSGGYALGAGRVLRRFHLGIIWNCH
jgi:cysteine/O-acetylserine efflux protein